MIVCQNTMDVTICTVCEGNSRRHLDFQPSPAVLFRFNPARVACAAAWWVKNRGYKDGGGCGCGGGGGELELFLQRSSLAEHRAVSAIKTAWHVPYCCIEAFWRRRRTACAYLR